jgi:hypothetical protein
MSRGLEDIFSGFVELEASERAYILHALSEAYMNGGWLPVGRQPGELMRSIGEKLGVLKLTKMVVPDGSKLVSVAEHDALVAAMEADRKLITYEPDPHGELNYLFNEPHNCQNEPRCAYPCRGCAQAKVENDSGDEQADSFPEARGRWLVGGGRNNPGTMGPLAWGDWRAD